MNADSNGISLLRRDVTPERCLFGPMTGQESSISRRDAGTLGLQYCYRRLSSVVRPLRLDLSPPTDYRLLPTGSFPLICPRLSLIILVTALSVTALEAERRNVPDSVSSL